MAYLQYRKFSLDESFYKCGSNVMDGAEDILWDHDNNQAKANLPDSDWYLLATLIPTDCKYTF